MGATHAFVGCSAPVGSSRPMTSSSRSLCWARRVCMKSSWHDLDSEGGCKSDCVRVVKICGLSCAEDAKMVAEVAARHLSADQRLLMGMILWPKSKRSVQEEEARRISEIAREAGAASVGVFVDEDAARIMNWRNSLGLDYVQLHGTPCRELYDELPREVAKIYVVDVQPDSHYVLDRHIHEEDLLLFDSKGGGTGRAFDWINFRPPQSRPWLLAGGLSDENVEEALQIVDPWGVDVASGVSDDGKVRKHRDRLECFLRTLGAEK